ncbi:uncharacterized protein TNIN_312651 [Trichonephila inaurata madagascariensis]|uniref:Uncharacterized protein n=1 Tax=Trichonephila inaurata madagascariensis TaxID=2747483 RepID=A0A8X6ICU4_9ARAC|nr:uncharacterized protein TNIN_312651 [Trichonephila inaurata madagascariensis]
MCLFEFAMNFEPIYAKKVGDSEESIDVEKEEQPTRQRPINLANNTKMVIRKVPTVVRLPFFSNADEPRKLFLLPVRTICTMLL